MRDPVQGQQPKLIERVCSAYKCVSVRIPSTGHGAGGFGCLWAVEWRAMVGRRERVTRFESLKRKKKWTSDDVSGELTEKSCARLRPARNSWGLRSSVGAHPAAFQ